MAPSWKNLQTLLVPPPQHRHRQPPRLRAAHPSHRLGPCEEWASWVCLRRALNAAQPQAQYNTALFSTLVVSVANDSTLLHCTAQKPLGTHLQRVAALEGSGKSTPQRLKNSHLRWAASTAPLKLQKPFAAEIASRELTLLENMLQGTDPSTTASIELYTCIWHRCAELTASFCLRIQCFS